MGAFVSSLAFPVPRCSEELIQTLRARPDFVQLVTAEGDKIAAIHIKRNAGRTILYSHGNAEDLILSVQYLDIMATICGADVLAYDYHGYSASEGTPSEAGCYACVEAAYQWLLANGVEPQNIVAFGRSLGSGPTVDLVSRHPAIAGMVLQSPLESGGRAALGCCCFGRLASSALYDLDIFRNYEKIGEIACPVLIIHGRADKVVPFHNGEALFAACQNAVEPVWINRAGHNDLPIDVCLRRVRLFMDGIDKVASSYATAAMALQGPPRALHVAPPVVYVSVGHAGQVAAMYPRHQSLYHGLQPAVPVAGQRFSVRSS